MKILSRRIKESPFKIISLGFFAVILLGALLLMIPVATRGEGGASFGDALFTATSAVCVTGLVVQDTATYWSEFGQVVIISLIQIGGLGVITVALSLGMLMRRRISLMQRSTMKEAISAPKVGGIVEMTGFILKSVFLIELLGAIALATVFCPEFGFVKGMWYAIFHSISAFCNAGFDLMGIKEPYSSLTSYVTNPVVNITIMSLIIIGGLGFFTWEDIKKNKWRLRRYRLQSKIVLLVTSALIFVPTLYFFFVEYSHLPVIERLWSSLFQTVTPRTAGFNTVNLMDMSEVGIMIMTALMLIGGSPGSTAGGMKTTTLAVLLSSAFSVFRRKNSTQVFHRRVMDSTVKDAATIFLMYIILFWVSGMIIACIEDIPVVTALYETASAIGTVGLTLGITPELGTVSKIILIVLMYFGRVGGLTLIFAAVSGRNANVSKYPQEKITVG